MKAFRVMGRVLKATYDELFLLVWLSVLWWIGVLLIVTAAPATMGLNRVANRIANYKRVDSSYFWEGGKQYFGRSWPLFLFNFLLPVGIVFNIWFYGANDGWMRVVAVLWVWVLILLLMMGQYFFPLFWQQEDRGLLLILRNALLLLASLLFYAWGEKGYVLLMLASILVNFFIGRRIDAAADPQKRKYLGSRQTNFRRNERALPARKFWSPGREPGSAGKSLLAC